MKLLIEKKQWPTPSGQVCERERKGEREREGEGGREGERERGREGERGGLPNTIKGGVCVSTVCMHLL